MAVNRHLLPFPRSSVTSRLRPKPRENLACNHVTRVTGKNTLIGECGFETRLIRHSPYIYTYKGNIGNKVTRLGKTWGSAVTGCYRCYLGGRAHA